MATTSNKEIKVLSLCNCWGISETEICIWIFFNNYKGLGGFYTFRTKRTPSAHPPRFSSRTEIITIPICSDICSPLKHLVNAIH
jgi:hypothetical protein